MTESKIAASLSALAAAGFRHELGCSPGGEGEDGHEPQEGVTTVGLCADAGSADCIGSG
jgi:hypothetical protein